MAELAPDKFVVIGFDAHIQFRPKRGAKQQSAQLLRAEEGTFVDGTWRTDRVLNGDQTFFTADLPAHGAILRLKVMAY